MIQNIFESEKRSPFHLSNFMKLEYGIEKPPFQDHKSYYITIVY